MSDETRKELISYYKWIISLEFIIIAASISLVSAIESVKITNWGKYGIGVLLLSVLFNWFLVKRLVVLPIASATPPERQTIVHRLFAGADGNIKIYAALQNLALLLGTVLIFSSFYFQPLEKGIGPNVSLYDVVIEQIDDTGTPMKRHSWLEGELLNNNAIGKGYTDLLLALKFKNTGKYAGYIQLTNNDEITSLIDSTKTGDNSIEKIFSPAESVTGLVYPYEVTRGMTLISEEGHIGMILPFKIGVFDTEGSIVQKLNFNIKCTKFMVTPTTYQLGCAPIE